MLFDKVTVTHSPARKGVSGVNLTNLSAAPKSNVPGTGPDNLLNTLNEVSLTDKVSTGALNVTVIREFLGALITCFNGLTLITTGPCADTVLMLKWKAKSITVNKVLFIMMIFCEIFLIYFLMLKEFFIMLKVLQ